MSTIDEYLKDQATPAQRKEFERVRNIVRQVVPGVTEKISYGIPTFYYKDKYIIYFGAFKDHMSLYPASDQMIEAIGEDLAKLRTSKGTLQYTEKNLISDALLKKIIEFRFKSVR